MVRLWCLVLISCFLFNPLTYAANEQRFSASVHKTNISMEESLILTLTAEGIQPDSPPKIPQIDGMKILYRGESTRGSSHVSIIVNGRQRVIKNKQTIVYQYELIPQKIGRVTIPSISVSANGQRYRTNPISIIVSQEPPNKERDVFLEVSLSEQTCYVEQPVVLELKWYFSKNIQSYALDIPFLPAFRNFIIKSIEPDAQKHDYQKVQYNDQVVEYFEKSSTLYNGVQFITLTLRKIIVPASSGTFTFDPAILRCDVLKGYRESQDQFDDFGFGSFFSRRRPVVQRRLVRSKPVSLIVNPLPPVPAGFPSNVSVGNYRMDVSASPRKVKAGEPVTLTMIVRGSGNVEGIMEPQVTNLKDFRVFQEDAKTDINVTSAGIEGQKVFQTLLIPLSDRVKQIPPMELAYFDTVTATYRRIVSDPIPITVTPAPVTNEPVIISGKKDMSGKKNVQILHRDLPGYIKFNAGTLIINGQYLYRRAWFKLLFVFPLLINILLGLVLKRQRRLKQDVSYRRKLTAKKRAEKTIRQAHKCIKTNNTNDFYSLLVRAINEYVGDKLSIPSAGLTEDVVREKLERNNIEPDLIDRLTKFYRQADMARFMPSSQKNMSLTDTLNELKTIINRLEKHKW